ncbi:unnamed protein product [Knipowitschia caucasica]
MAPGENSLSTLLADISSLLTFDSISGGGDIMADVEAEWGKASAALLKPLSSPSSSVSPQHFNSVHAALPSSPAPSSPMKPSSIITTLTKSTTLTTPTIKPANEMAANITTAATKPSATPITITPIMSSPTITMKHTTAPPNTPATATKASSETSETTKTTSSFWFKTAPPPAMVSPPKTTPFTLSSMSKPDLTSSFQATSYNKVPVTVSVSYPISAQPLPPTPLISSKTTTTEVNSAAISVSTPSISPPAQLCTAGLNKTFQPLVSENSSSTNATFAKSQVSAEPVPPTILNSQALPMTNTAAVYLNGTIPSQLPASALTQISKAPSSSLSVSKDGPLSLSQPKMSPAPSEMPSFLSKTSTQTSQISASSPQIPSVPTTFTHTALSQTSSCPVSSTPLPRDSGMAREKRESDTFTVDRNLTSAKTPEPRDVLQEDSQQLKEDRKRTSQGHSTTGVSKIPVVGGGRVGKIPVRVSQNSEEEANKDTATPAPEEPVLHLNSREGKGKVAIPVSEIAVVTSKYSPEESPQMLSKAPSNSPRDSSKIPVKHGSQIPQANRTKIPVSKVPVRRAAGAKPTAQSGSMQLRK